MKLFNYFNFKSNFDYKKLPKTDKSSVKISNSISDSDFRTYSSAMNSYGKNLISFGCNSNPTVLKQKSPYLDTRNLLFNEIDGFGFEELLADFFIATGEYDDVELTPSRKDGGVDIMLYKGDTSTIVQSKHWKTPATIDEVDSLHYCKNDWGADNAILYSSSGVDDEAYKTYQELSGIDNDKYDFKILNIDDLIKNANEIGFDLSYDAVKKYSKSERNNINTRLENEKEQIIQERKSGWRIKQIADNHGCGLETIRNKLIEWDIDTSIQQSDIDKKLEKEKEQIIQEHENGWTLEQIADNHGCGESSIRKKLIEWGVDTSRQQSDLDKKLENEKEQIIQERKKGWSIEQIADNHGCSFDTIHKKLKEWGIDTSRQQSDLDKKLENEKEKIIQEYENRRSIKQIADNYGCSEPTIRNKLKEWGVYTNMQQSDLDKKLENEKEQIIQERKKGWTLEQIADNHGCGLEIIRKKLKEWGIDTSMYQSSLDTRLNNEKEQIIQEHENGWSIKQIADNHGCGERKIRKKLKEWGIDTSIQQSDIDKKLENEKEQIIQERKSGWRIKQIADNHGCGLETIRKKLKEWGINTSRQQTKSGIKLEENENELILNNGAENREDWLNLTNPQYAKQVAIVLKKLGYAIDTNSFRKNQFNMQKDGINYTVRAIANKKPLNIDKLRAYAGYIDHNDYDKFVLVTGNGLSNSKETDKILDDYKDKLVIKTLDDILNTQNSQNLQMLALAS